MESGGRERGRGGREEEEWAEWRKRESGGVGEERSLGAMVKSEDEESGVEFVS